MVHSKIRSRWVMVVVLTLVAAFAPSSPAHAEESQYGFPTVSRPDFDALALKGSVPTNWALAYQLAEYRPDDYGYPLVVDGVVVVKARGAAAQKVALDMAAGGSVEFEHAYGKTSRLTFAPSDGSIRVEQTQRVVSQEQELAGEIASLGISPEHHVVGLKGVSVSPWDGRYVVTVHNFTEAFATALRALVAPELVLIALDDDPTPTSIASRGDDYSPHRGGSRIWTEATGSSGTCTAGFPWTASGVDHVLFAGHCRPNGLWMHWPNGDTIYVYNLSRENWNSGTGTVPFSGSSGHQGDLALGQLMAGWASSSVYVGGTASNTSVGIEGRWSRYSQVGDQLCTGGQTTGELCGWTVTELRLENPTNDGIARNVVIATNTGPCIKGGDSGGPVYTKDANGLIWAKGIINTTAGGGGDGFGGTFDKCVLGFTDIQRAWEALPGDVKQV